MCLISKSFALLHASDRSIFARQSLIEILTTMSGLHVIQADITIDLRVNPAQANEVLLSDNSRIKIRSALEILAQFIIDRYLIESKKTCKVNKALLIIGMIDRLPK